MIRPNYKFKKKLSLHSNSNLICFQWSQIVNQLLPVPGTHSPGTVLGMHGLGEVNTFN